jgi:acetylornithine deacetylase/succinyl-diaminopimelate desuccinylase-like protein
MIDGFRASLASSLRRHVDELRRLVEIPSVSAQHRGIDECCQAVVGLLEARGMRTAVHETPYAPVITAHGGGGDTTLLFYEHYDVQPEDPLDEWTTPPFQLTERDGKMYGRGAADTKGNLICRLAAIDAAREVLGDDPIAYTFVIEGEEEIGSPNLEPFIAAHADELRADACLWESGGVDADDRPRVSIGMKGIATFDLRCRVSSYDLHSSLGAVVDNPLYRIAAAIASLRDEAGRVTIDGFLDDVVPLGPADEDALAAVPDHTEQMRRTYGVAGFLGGASGTDLNRRLYLAPCVNVNGIHGGYGGDGTKTVLPREAIAKLDIRLVPRQNPDRVLRAVREHLDRRGFTDVEVVPNVGEWAGRTAVDDPFVALVARTAELAYGVPPVILPSSAGTGPAHPFVEHLRVPFAGAGCNYPGGRAHAPDEHVRIEDFERGRLHSALIVAGLGGRL